VQVYPLVPDDEMSTSDHPAMLGRLVRIRGLSSASDLGTLPGVKDDESMIVREDSARSAFGIDRAVNYIEDELEESEVWACRLLDYDCNNPVEILVVSIEPGTEAHREQSRVSSCHDEPPPLS
jgi:hypothetical protein